MALRFIATLDVPLLDVGTPSFAERDAMTSPSQTVKGMFFDDVVRILGDDLASYAGELVAHPRGGRYLPFSSYPLRDHARLAHHAARKLHPGVSMRESLRRLHRGNTQAFARSNVGKVLMALAGDVKSGFARVEAGYALSRVSGTVHVKTIEERAIEVRFVNANPWLDCADLGTLEGMGSFFDKAFRTEVVVENDTNAAFVCRWRD